MDKKWIILCLSVALAVTSVTAGVSYANAYRSQRLLQDALNERVLETQEHLQSMAVKLSKAPVAGDQRTCVELLSGVSRQADGVVTALSALPVSHAAMGDTVKFCNQLSDYALMLTLKAAAGQLPTAEDVEMLEELKNQCTLLAGKLATAEPITQPEESRFAADADHGMDYPSMIYDGAFSDARHRGTPLALEGEKAITQEEAIERARDFIGADRVENAQASVPTGGAIACFGVTLTLRDGSILNADVTQKGGRMLWIMPEHANFPSALTLEECTQKAAQFLLSRGYGEMEANHYQVYDGLAVINFVAVKDGALLYPDLIKVQLRMDTGELVGLESNNYLMNHTPRETLAPAVTEQQARESISPRLEITQTRLCVIPYRDSERLCWEARGVYENREYRVYVDANTGEEIQVLQMVDGVNGVLAV